MPNVASPQNNVEISVVLVVKNAVSTVERAVHSVLAQEAVGIELVIVDGVSTDGTFEILSRYGDHIAHLISEPDEGIADAMNKGVASSHGEWVYFLGADDHLASKDVFSDMLRSADDSDTDIIAGAVLVESRVGQLRRLIPRGFGFGANFKMPLLHQGSLCRRTLFDRIGAFDGSLSIAMDYEFFLRAHRVDASVVHVEKIIAVMDDGGVGSRIDWHSVSRRIREERRVHLRHCDSLLLRSIYAAYHPLYLAYRKLRALAGT